MKVQADKIPSGGRRFEVEEAAEHYELSHQDFLFNDPIRIAVNVEVVSATLIVSGTLSTKIQLRCSRCLKDFSEDWANTDYHFDCALPDPHDTIDLTDDIREDIILGLPVKPLCREGCKGLCQACGKDWNTGTCKCEQSKTDLRWYRLDSLNKE
jgi:uncharacterized protein